MLLEVKNLNLKLNTSAGAVIAVHNLSFSVASGKTIGIVGESGCGKSLTAQTLIKLLPDTLLEIESGEILFNGRDLVALSENEMRKIRGKEVGYVFQEPMTALNPVYQVGKQVGEVLEIHEGNLSRAEIKSRTLEMFEKVGIPEAEKKYHAYPHELSGGLRQRVVIAMALMSKPKLLIADEPTTALDVTLQAQILELIRSLQQEFKMAVVFISHDLGVISEMADEILVMYSGMMVEKALTSELFRNPKHPYTQALLHAMPRIGGTEKPSIESLVGIPGQVPSLFDLPKGCYFQNRCSKVKPQCLSDMPLVSLLSENHFVRCVEAFL